MEGLKDVHNCQKIPNFLDLGIIWELIHGNGMPLLHLFIMFCRQIECLTIILDVYFGHSVTLIAMQDVL